MKKFLSLLLACAFLGNLQAVGATEIKNRWFSLVLPPGWQQMEVSAENDDPAETILLTNKKANCAISISLAPNNGASAEKIAAVTHEKMKVRGMEVGVVENNNGVYSFTTAKKPASGKAYFGASPTLVAIVTIWGAQPEAAKPVFKALKANDPKLFPQF